MLLFVRRVNPRTITGLLTGLIILFAFVGCAPVIDVPPAPTAAPLHITIDGLVDKPFTLTAENAADFPVFERASIMVCPTDTYETEEATWQGIRLSDLFEAAEIRPEAATFVVYADYDDYRQAFKLTELDKTDIFLALTKDNRSMNFVEGGSARIVAHEEWGYRWVRWVSRIEVTGP